MFSQLSQSFSSSNLPLHFRVKQSTRLSCLSFHCNFASRFIGRCYFKVIVAVKLFSTLWYSALHWTLHHFDHLTFHIIPLLGHVFIFLQLPLTSAIVCMHWKEMLPDQIGNILNESGNMPNMMRTSVCWKWLLVVTKQSNGLIRLKGYPPSQIFLGHIPLILFPADCLFVTEYFTRTPRKLSAFNSFASVELFHFNVPDDTMMAVWNLITFKEQGGTFGDSCPNRNVTV